MGSYVATYITNETHSIAHLQHLIPTIYTYEINTYKYQCAAKVGFKSCRYARECVLLVVYVRT